MWQHSVSHHQGQIGVNKGINDYKFVLTGQFNTNIQRQTNEGRRQAIFEGYQEQNKLIVLNSKLDFIQPLMTQLVTRSSNINNKPGQKNRYTTRTTTTSTKSTKINQTRKILKGKRRTSIQFQPKIISTPKKQQQQQRNTFLSPILNINTNLSYVFQSPVKKNRRRV